MRRKGLGKILLALGVATFMLVGSMVAMADGPKTGEPGSELQDSTEIWAEIKASLLTRLEQCETFGAIPSGVVSDLLFNTGGPVYVRSVDGKPFPSREEDSDVLANWGPGILNGVGALVQTEKIDYNVSGNVTFDTKVYVVDDFKEVTDKDTIPVANRLSIERLIGTPSFVTFAGTGSNNAIQVLDNEDPTNAGDAGLSYGFNLRLDVPDDTLPGLYHTTLTFVTYQS